MRALTLTQPWAGLVASGIKLVENRPRQMIKREDFGVPFALHASREIDKDVYISIHEIAPELYDYESDGKTMSNWRRLSRITSAVIAVVTIDRVVGQWQDGSPSIFDGDPGLGDQRRWFFGPVGYVLRDVRALATPVLCRGWQGFWTLTDDLDRAVTAQIASAP
jgi:hypothetical protein